MPTIAELNAKGAHHLPGHLGIVVQAAQQGEVHGEMGVCTELMAPNGFLHAGSVITLADTCAGYGCMASLPEGAVGFTTVELKSNFLGTAREGMVRCVAKAVHLGKTTQVWDAVVTHADTGKTMALFRCTQMVLYGR